MDLLSISQQFEDVLKEKDDLVEGMTNELEKKEKRLDKLET